MTTCTTLLETPYTLVTERNGYIVITDMHDGETVLIDSDEMILLIKVIEKRRV